MLQRNSIKKIILFILYSRNNRDRYSFENLMKDCFKAFPRVFSLKGYPQFPDTRKLSRPLRSLRRKKLVKGNPQTFFSLTVAGRKLAKEIADIFRQERLKL